MKIKTRELKGTALDWAVAKCGGREGSSKALGLVQVEEDPLERRRKVFTLTVKG